MYNYALQSGKRVIDKYRDGASKLYDLCDFINKKAMNWYSLNWVGHQVGSFLSSDKSG